MLEASALTAVILCGGQARRLGGQSKALLIRDGETLLSRLEAFIAPYVARTLAVAPAPTQTYLRPHTGSEFIEDPQTGPGKALSLAAAHVRTPWLVLLNVDCVAPDATAMQRLVSAAEDGDGAVCFGNEPFWALYRCEALRSLAVPDGGSLRAILRDLDTRSLESSHDLTCFDDVDTLDDVTRHGLTGSERGR